MVINHNLMANNAIRSMNSNSASASKSMQKLSSGLRINSAADDAAGLAISEKMRGQIRGLDQASSNAQDGISMTQTAEGALNETQSILQRMRELSNQAANGTNTTDDRGSIQDEMNQLTSEINRIGNTTEFNTQKLLNGGIGSTDGQKITQATSADLKSGTFTATNATGIGAKLTVDNVTFDFANVGVSLSGDTATTMVNKLKDITSGGTKLSDLVDVTNNSGKIEFKAKSQGANSSVTLKTTDAAASNVFGTTAAASTITATGDPTLVEKAGLEATAKLDAADKTILKGDSIKITVGSDSAVTVDLNSIADKTYNTSNSDKNVSKAAMSDLIKDVNAAIQKAGLSDKVEASLSKDNKVQFISKQEQILVLLMEQVHH